MSSFGSVLGTLWDIRKLHRGIFIWEVLWKEHSEKKKQKTLLKHNKCHVTVKNNYLLRQSDDKRFQRQTPNRPLKR